MNTEFDSEPVYDDYDKYINRKIKMYKDRANTNFLGKKVPKENASYKCLSLIMLDSVISILMNTEFDSEPVYDDYDKYINRKIKMYKDRANTNFLGKKVPKENASYKCLSLIMLDSVIRVNKKNTVYKHFWKSLNM